MPLTRTVQVYYDQGQGPLRDGHRRHKQAIYPTLTGRESTGDLVALVDELCDWGQNEFHNDHGTYETHQQLVNLFNLVVRLVPGAQELVDQA